MAHKPDPTMYEFYIEYTTQTEADIFCRGCWRAICYRVGPGQYQIWLYRQ